MTGRAEIWQTLRTTLEILWEADLVDAAKAANETDTVATTTTTTAASPASPPSPTSPASTTPPKSSKVLSPEAAEARATAQSILDAADITLPTGDMAQGAYDAFGNFYAMPAWIVSDPTNLASDPEHDSDLDETKGALDDLGGEANLSEESDIEDDEEEVDDDDEDTCGDEARHRLTTTTNASTTTRRRRREEKGKAVANAAAAANLVNVRARLSATSRDVIVHLAREEPVRSLAHRISEQAKLPHGTRIRIAYLGKILKDNTSLQAQGWKEGHVVNALVFEAT